MCRFGQWYYDAANAALHGHPGFAAIGTQHERMHRLATSLLRSSAIGGPISRDDHESFVVARNQLDLEMASVRHEFEEELSSLDPLTGRRADSECRPSFASNMQWLREARRPASSP